MARSSDRLQQTQRFSEKPKSFGLQSNRFSFDLKPRIALNRDILPSAGGVRARGGINSIKIINGTFMVVISHTVVSFGVARISSAF